jgi:DNA-binding beta-propeller fold protein YncE
MKKTMLAVLLVGCFSATIANAEPKITTVVDGLNNPCGIAIQPETNILFVADSAASRIIRIVDGKAEAVVTDFPVDVYGKGPMFNIGPLGLVFMDKNTLVVGGGGLKDGAEMLRVYNVGGDLPIKADAMSGSATLPAADEVRGEGNLYGLVRQGEAVYVTCNGDDTKGWIAKAMIKDGKVASFERFIATKEATEVDAPVAITESPRKQLVVGQGGEVGTLGDGLLSYYNPADGKLVANFETGLSDITALVYNASDGQLYATDFSWADTTKGGLFRIIASEKDGKEVVRTKKVCDLDKPTAMVADADGNLYVTSFGSGEEGKLTGSVVKIQP